MEKSYKNKAYVCDILISLQTNQEEKVKFNLHYCYDTMDSVAPLVLILRTRVRKANLFGYISQIQNIFVLFNSSSIRGVMIKNI